MNITGRLLYRAKAKDGGEWVFGRPQRNSITGKWYIQEGKTTTEVDPATISQATGKYAKGSMMFEGDNLLISKKEKVTIVWDEQIAGFSTEPRITYAEWGWRETVTDHSDRIDIIGNKWDGEEKRRAAGRMRKKKPAARIIEPKSKQYPIRDQHRRHYVRYPVKVKGNKWVAADVLLGKKGGFISPEANPGAHKFKTEEECQKACNVHNDWHFGISTIAGETYVNDIISRSMKLSLKDQGAKVLSDIEKPMGSITSKPKPRLA